MIRKISAFIVFMTLLVLTACGGSQVKRDATPVEVDPPLGKPYKTILFEAFETTPVISKDYPNALEDCQSSAIATLEKKGSFRTVGLRGERSGLKGETLLIKVKVSDMRIAGTSARIWGGSLAGVSYMNLDLEFVDLCTNRVVRKKSMATQGNPMAATWSFGATDRNMPHDMGLIIGEYIVAIVPNP